MAFFSANGRLNGGIVTGTYSTFDPSASAAMDLDAVNALSINSSAGVINVGNDAVAQAINVGTGAAARTITIGNVTGASALNFDAGTGGISFTGDSTFDNDVVVTGNLDVQGTTTTVDSTNVLVKDPHLYLNNGYTTASGKTGGLGVNYLPTATTTNTVGAGVFVAGVAATSNPTVTTAGSATFSATDLIQISDAADSNNNGLFEVLSHITTTLTIRGIGTSATLEDFTQDQFTANAGDTGATITKVTVSVLRSGTDGIWESGAGSTSGITFVNVGDLTGPGSATDNALARFDETTGKIIQNSGVTLSDDGGAGMTLGHTASGAGDDLTIALTGANDSSIILTSAGTGTDSVSLIASAGGITATVADEKDLKLGNAGGDAYFIVAASATAGSEDVRVVNTNGTDEAAIAISSTSGGVDIDAAAAKNVDISGGQVLITSKDNAASAISLVANVGVSETIVLTNTQGTDAAAIALTATAGGVTITTGSGVISVGGSATQGSEIRLGEDTDNGTSYVGLKAANSLAGNVTLTLPNAAGSSDDHVYTTDGTTLAFQSPMSAITSIQRLTVVGPTNENGSSVIFGDTTLNAVGINLQDGTVDGEHKFFLFETDGGSDMTVNCGSAVAGLTNSLIDASGTAATTLTFSTAGQSCILLWSGTTSTWYFANGGATVA